MNVFNHEEPNRYDKKQLIYVLIFIVVILSLMFKFLITPPTILKVDLSCLEFVKQGTLYGGQPLCVYGPVFYVSMFLFREISENNFNLLVMATIIILHLLSFLIIYKIINKEVIKDVED